MERKLLARGAVLGHGGAWWAGVTMLLILMVILLAHLPSPAEIDEYIKNRR